MTRRRISILGSTGSIGVSTLDVVAQLGGRDAFEVVTLTGRDNVALLAEQAKAVGARHAVTSEPRKYAELKERLAGSGTQAAAGPEALVALAGEPADLTMAGIVGIAGLAPTLAAAKAGATIALANKECLVSGGALFTAEIEKAGSFLLPVDSEHNAIFQVLDTAQAAAVERIIITASGGPFRTWPVEKMRDVTPEAAAAHPNWSMGRKISIDSASLFNKALEMIEADRLFGAPGRTLEVVVHPQSVVHSMVGYTDGSVLAQLGAPDMRTAIGYAIGWPRRPMLDVERLDLIRMARLDFEAPDEVRFPALRLAREVIAAGGLAGAVLNGAKEVALEAFIARRIGFLDIAAIVERVMDRLGAPAATDIETVHEIDRRARAGAAALIAAAP
ncbi:MAG: 1-deoxy-D-xylulose-5-phosphate reductoisomerase [Rhizobiaceae bacterium]